MATLLHFGFCNAILATLLALAVGAARPLLRRRPALAHGLWLLVLLKLVTPPLLAVPLPWPESAATSPAPIERFPTRAARLLLPEDAVPAGVADLLAPVDLPGEMLPAPTAEQEAQAPSIWSWQEVLLALWLTGALAWWALAGGRVARFRRLLRAAGPGPAAVQEQAVRLARRLGLRRCPQVRFVPAAVSPLLWALGWAPRLLLPANLWEHLSAAQQDALLAHELAHLRRRDHWVRRLELLVLGLYWWHPAVWWARRELREAEEQCCDAWVVWALPEAAPAYAAALVETVAFLGRARSALPLGASGIGHPRTLKRRLLMILQTTPPRSLSAPGALAVLGLGALLLPLWPALAQQTSGPLGEDLSGLTVERLHNAA